MCLAVPAQLVECEGDEATADLHGNRVRINTLLVAPVAVGDWVLIHAGFAIQKLDYSEAQETWAILKDIEKAEAGEASGSEGSAHAPHPALSPEYRGEGKR